MCVCVCVCVRVCVCACVCVCVSSTNIIVHGINTTKVLFDSFSKQTNLSTSHS